MAKANLSAMLDSVSGKVGEFAIVQLKTGPVVRQRPRYKRPVSPAQRDGINRLKEATHAYNTFSAAQAEAWRSYAETITHTCPQTGQRYSPSGFNTFTALATKFRQVNPTAPLPLDPPAGPFIPDDPLLSAQGLTGKIRFSATGANRPGVTTELLLQKLANPRRRPSGAYKSTGFHVFGATFDLAVEPGVYACAYRFVEIATGRVAMVMTLDVVVVG